MRILYDHQIFSEQYYGGPSRYFFNIIKEISKKEKIKISAPIHINNYLTELTKDNVFGLKINSHVFNKIPYRIRNLLLKKLINKINVFYLKKIQKKFEPNLLHKTYFDNYKTNLPVVLTVYDLIHEKFHELYGKEKNYRPKKQAIERADEIICISQNTLQDLNRYYDIKNKKTSVIYLGSDLNKKKYLDQNISFSNDKYLLYVGKRNGYKNFKNFIKAYSISERLKNNFNIYCFGGGKFKKNEFQMFKEFGIEDKKIVYFEGDDSILINLYENASALIYPSKYEGFGLPILEAMSFECPVICSNKSSIPEVGGDAVEYFDPESIENIKHAICNTVFSDSKIKDLKTIASKRAKLFNWSKCASETIEVYKKLI
jgi:glycosyltransferase involved in cell wall biosynthesis